MIIERILMQNFVYYIVSNESLLFCFNLVTKQRFDCYFGQLIYVQICVIDALPELTSLVDTRVRNPLQGIQILPSSKTIKERSRHTITDLGLEFSQYVKNKKKNSPDTHGACTLTAIYRQFRFQKEIKMTGKLDSIADILGYKLNATDQKRGTPKCRL
jgi:hypothetical protein